MRNWYFTVLRVSCWTRTVKKYLQQTVLEVVPVAVTNPPFPPHIMDGLTVPGARVRFGICIQSEPVVLVPLVPYPQHGVPIIPFVFFPPSWTSVTAAAEKHIWQFPCSRLNDKTNLKYCYLMIMLRETIFDMSLLKRVFQ